MAGVTTPREVYEGEHITPLQENSNVPQNDGKHDPRDIYGAIYPEGEVSEPLPL